MMKPTLVLIVTMFLANTAVAQRTPFTSAQYKFSAVTAHGSALAVMGDPKQETNSSGQTFSKIQFYASASGTDSYLVTVGVFSNDLVSDSDTKGIESSMVGEGAGCRPGDLEIGRQETADEIIVYCSRVSCEQISSRVKQDIDAQETLENSMGENNADLHEWARKNEEQQRAALKTATDALFKSLVAFSEERMDTKIVRLQEDLKRRSGDGETVTATLEKARAFESAYTRWSEVSDGLRTSLTPGLNSADTWVRLQQWAAKAGKESAALSAAWAALSSDIEVHQILRDERLDTAFDHLNQGLSPVLSGSFEMAKFLMDYGYDASAWQASRLQILQRSDQADKNLLAECKLDRLMKIDVRNMNVCDGRLPNPNVPDPEELRCGAAR